MIRGYRLGALPATTQPGGSRNGYPKGRRCAHCPRTEADCARNGQCCNNCTHTFGEPKTPPPVPLTVCHRCRDTFPANKKGRPRKFCDTCRAHFRNERERARRTPRAGDA